MIDGNLVRLRSWHEGDIDILTELRNDLKLQSQLLSRARGSNFDQTRHWIKKIKSSPSNFLLIVADKDSDLPIGYIQFIDIDPIDQIAKLGICLSSNAQGKGLGYESLNLAFNYLHNYFSIRKIILNVRSDNMIAIKCYEKIGFNQCGRHLRHNYLEGTWHDLIIMELFLDNTRTNQ
jgi:diamine N-acetyltransferase